MRPEIVIESREQTPLLFTRLASCVGTLQSGDYSFVGPEEQLAIERKTIADLVRCCTGDNRARFFRELHRLRGFRFKRLLIVGNVGEIECGEYRSQVKPAAVLAPLASIEARFDVPVVLAPTPVDGAHRIESWAYWFAREQIESVNAIARPVGLRKIVKTHG